MIDGGDNHLPDNNKKKATLTGTFFSCALLSILCFPYFAFHAFHTFISWVSVYICMQNPIASIIVEPRNFNKLLRLTTTATTTTANPKPKPTGTIVSGTMLKHVTYKINKVNKYYK